MKTVWPLPQCTSLQDEGLSKQPGLGLDLTGIGDGKRIFHRLMTSEKNLWLVAGWQSDSHSPGDQ